MINNKLLAVTTFALIPFPLIWSSAVSYASTETANSSKLIQCLKNIRNSRASQAMTTKGIVEVAIDTDSQGKVTNVRLVRSSGNTKLDEKILLEARNWKLKPPTSNDVRVNTTPIKRQTVC